MKIPQETGFIYVLSQLDNSVNKIIMEWKRSKVLFVQKTDDDRTEYRFAFKLYPLKTPRDLRAENYLTHQLRKFISETGSVIKENIQKYIDLNGGDLSNVIEDVIEESFSEYLVKNSYRTRLEWEHYNENPHLPQSYKKIEGPLMLESDIKSLNLQGDECAVVVLTPKKLTINDDLKESLGENINHTINIVLRKNFRKYTTVLYKDEIDTYSAEVLGIGQLATEALIKGKTILIFSDHSENSEGHLHHKIVAAPMF